MKKVTYLFLAIFMLSCIVVSPLLFAKSIPSAVIIFSEGSVEYKEDNSSSWKDADMGTKLYKGYSLKTGRDSACDVSILCMMSRIVTLDENTEIKVDDLVKGKIKMKKGRVFSMIKDLPEGSTFEVQTPVAVAGIRGSGMVVSVNGTTMWIESHRGSVYLFGLNKQGEKIGLKFVPVGLECFAHENSEPGSFATMDQEKLDMWDNWMKNVVQHIKDFLKASENAELLGMGNLEDLFEQLEQSQEDKFEFFDSEKIEDQRPKTPKKKIEQNRDDTIGTPVDIDP